ncbi:MAG TPA: outer membrane beta-barrel protein [Verrucomicrobiae bacterium]|jgi:hypothetical protein|nr:outer membrane beta-barrel protein [Verrucomicrobiae bacterium]
MSNFFRSLIALAIVGLWSSTMALAVYAPEPQSGGRFFKSKGTKSAEEYRYLGRTGLRPEDYYDSPGLTYEGVRLKPYVGYSGDWDTNVFLTERDRSQDYINRLNWGTDVEVPLDAQKHLLYGGVHSESEWFAKNSSENHTDWVFQGGGQFNFNNFSLDLHEEFRDTVDRSNSELTARTERYENYLDGVLTIPFGQMFSETEVSHYNLEFDDEANQVFDRYELRISPRIGVNVGDRTQALVEYQLTNINYNKIEDRNGDAHQISLGLRGFLGQGDLVTYQVWGGWQVRNYDSDLRDDFTGPVWRADIEYRRSEISRFYASTKREPVESVTVNNSFITRTDLEVGWRRKLSERITGTLAGASAFHHYSNGRLDFLWEPKVGVDYLIPGRVGARLYTDYRWSARHSDADNQDYERSLLSFGIRAEV